jgi:hypothetical protein
MTTSAHNVRHALRRQVLGGGEGLAISREEFDDIRVAKELVLEALALEEKFELVVANFEEFERTLNDLALQNMIRLDWRYHALNDMRVLINLRAINLLNACDLYLDHGPQHVAAIRGHCPEISVDLKALATREFDSSDDYKIAYGVRNFAQHVGFPIRSFAPGGTRVERADGRRIIHFYLTCEIDTKGMLEDPQTRQWIREALTRAGPKLDARRVLRAFVSGLANVHAQIRKACDARQKVAVQRLQETIHQFQAASGEDASAIGLAAVEIGSDGRQTTVIEVFADLTDRLEAMTRRNREMPSLVDWHVSSEPPERRS